MLTLFSFKPIGKAVLHRAIGLSENYIVTENIKLLKPVIPSACRECPVYKERNAFSVFPQSRQYKDACASCKSCPNGKALEINTTIKPELISKEKKKYINEKNRYGYGKRLKLHSILLFLAYHMIVNNDKGIIRNVSISELASLLSCSEKAVRYNNAVLEREQYIYISPGVDGNHVNICLPEYESYFLTAKEGGRGFFTLSKELFESLNEISSTNSLRIVLKTILSLDDDVLDMEEIHLESYAQIRRYLPSYCKRNVVKNALSKLSSSIFSLELKEHYVSFKLNHRFNTKEMKLLLRKQNEEKFKTKIAEFNTLIHTAPADKTKLENIFGSTEFMELLPDMSILSSPAELKPLTVDENQLVSLVTLSLEYTYEHVWKALGDMYKKYILPDIKVHNMGGLLRDFIRKRIKKNYTQNIIPAI